MDEEQSLFEGLKNRLNEYTWPGFYLFKFIVPVDKIEEVVHFFNGSEYSTKESKHGRYMALTSNVFMSGPEQIIEIYIKASRIKGVISL